MLLLCAAAVLFVTLEGQATHWYLLQHLDALCNADGGFLGPALLGFGLSGNLWNGTMYCMYVCVAEYVWKRKWGCNEWQVIRIFWEWGHKTKRKWKEKKVSDFKPSDSQMTERSATNTSAKQRAMPPVHSTETHWRCLSGQLVLLCLHVPPDFLH